jgi:hypothetical protein
MLPSSPPPVRAYFEHREAKERDVARPLRWPAMTSPVLVAGRIAVALLEVEAGFRPGHQLERHCHPTLWDRLAPRLCFRGGPAITCRSLRRVLIQEHIPGLVDAVAVLERGRRVEAVAMRLDGATAQILTGELSAREVEDVDTAALSYAEVKALATGQPLLLEAATVAAGIAPPAESQTGHIRAQRRIRQDIDKLLGDAARSEERAGTLEAMAEHAAGRDPVLTSYGGRALADRAAIAKALAAAAATALQQGTRQHLGQWCGLSVEIAPTQGRDRPHPGLGSQCPRGHRPGGLPARGVVRGPPELAAAGPAVAHPDQP